MFDLIFNKDDSLFFLKNLTVHLGSTSGNDVKFRFAINPQGIWQFHVNCQIAKCQTVASLFTNYVLSIPVCRPIGSLFIVQTNSSIDNYGLSETHTHLHGLSMNYLLNK